MTQQHPQGCLDCVRKDNRLELKDRDLKETGEERDYWESQAKQTGQQRDHWQAEAEKALQQAQSAQAEAQDVKKASHETCNSLFGCPTHGQQAIKELETNPGLLPRETVEKLMLHYWPNIKDPVKVSY